MSVFYMVCSFTIEVVILFYLATSSKGSKSKRVKRRKVTEQVSVENKESSIIEDNGYLSSGYLNGIIIIFRHV